ncbi:hypothetical protein CERZMDRAFT_92869 [Cercospora zeae-maydis SCOH1-5]|uniref:Uncharacterized protein n=1 Tax=Cercospora zeae-maydis SCOH1-5 TaxID=717836 RepID=A0A6A6FTH8_9PEZI|nr:hypothetical protein CERZMDRAFT_92869 [Cercospora zeae-maydis SCOH1-5]
MCNSRCLAYICGHWDMVCLSPCRGVAQIPDPVTKNPTTVCYGWRTPGMFLSMATECRSCCIEQALKTPRARLSEAIRDFRKCRTGALVAKLAKATRELEVAIAELQAWGLPEKLAQGSKKDGVWSSPHKKVQEGSPLRRELVVDPSFELHYA